jgi:hypothetical protein
LLPCCAASDWASGGQGGGTPKRKATGVPGPSVAARAAGNGSPAAPLEPAMLKTVRRRRHATALTTHTLAEQLGLAADELDAAINGQPVPQAAAERLKREINKQSTTRARPRPAATSSCRVTARKPLRFGTPVGPKPWD